jgi:hypothetical protein
MTIVREALALFPSQLEGFGSGILNLGKAI